jgi:hypothetical protein
LMGEAGSSGAYRAVGDPGEGGAGREAASIQPLTLTLSLKGRGN